MPGSKRRTASAQTRPLGPLERQVMEVVWRLGDATVADVVDALKPRTDAAYTTVMTVMTRLTQKRLLKRHLQGRGYLYSPVSSREAYEEALSRARIRGLIEEFGDVAIAQFAEELRDVDPDRARRLGALLRQRSQ